MAPPPSQIGAGRYTVRGVLGEGGQGVTYDAVDAGSGAPVAIKRFDVRGARTWKDVELAERETRVLATLDHPLVPRYVEHFEDDGALYLVMQKVDGETLESMRQRHGPLPEDEVRRFLACADRALTYLHGRSSPVVHRDLKPRNVIRRPDGSYVLVDFGAVTELMQRRGASTLVGTIGYMAPEQLQGRALPATDIYAVGATALAALTGADPDTLPHHGLRIDVRTVLRGRASPAMIAALEQMLEPDPTRRATSLGAALDGVRSASGSMPPPASMPARSRSSPPRGGPQGFPPHGPAGSQKSPEDAAVKSVRNLLWVLWGLGWIIVPVILGPMHLGRLIPPVMFVSLALLLVVTWHKGAVIRAVLRGLSKDAGRLGSPGARYESEVRQRVQVTSTPQVRVHQTDLRPDEVTGDTELSTHEPRPPARHLR